MPIFGALPARGPFLAAGGQCWVNMVAFLPSIPVVETQAPGRPGLIPPATTVPNGCVLEFNLRSVPLETTGLRPSYGAHRGGRPMALAMRPRSTVPPRPWAAGLIARVLHHIPSPAGAVQSREPSRPSCAVKPSLAWAEIIRAPCPTIWLRRLVRFDATRECGLVGSPTPHSCATPRNKAGIEAQFVARGEYKSAATTEMLHDAHRRSGHADAGQSGRTRWQANAVARNIGVDALDELAGPGLLMRDDVSGLVVWTGTDRFRDQAYARRNWLRKRFNGIQWLANVHEKPPRMYLARYASSARPRLTPPSHRFPVAGPADDRGGDPGRPDRQRSVASSFPPPVRRAPW